MFDHETGLSPITLNIAGISEGKESFTHCLVRLMCGTCDHLGESHNRSCTVHQLIYALVTHLYTPCAGWKSSVPLHSENSDSM